jgi:hypothetical protein
MTLADAARPIVSALFSTATSVLAFAVLRSSGAGTETSLVSGLILAGILNIRGLWSLTDDQSLPTSEQVLGS